MALSLLCVMENDASADLFRHNSTPVVETGIMGIERGNTPSLLCCYNGNDHSRIVDTYAGETQVKRTTPHKGLRLKRPYVPAVTP